MERARASAALITRLQFSPDKGELVRGGMTLRVGDRIIQRKNDYSRFGV